MNTAKQITSLALLSFSLSLPNFLYAKGEVTQINAHRETVSSTSYTVDSSTYVWQGDNLVIDSFEYNGTTYDYTVKADNVKIRRVDNAETTGERCALFAEADSEGSNNIKPSYPRLGTSDNCDMAAIMGGNVINRGVLDLFANVTGNPDTAKNIERVDFIFSGGVTTPIDPLELTETGVVVTEKSGNNDVLIAAILSLDASGDPASYGPAVRVYRRGQGSSSKYAYGITNIGSPLTFLSNERLPPQGYPSNILAIWESLGMSFIDMDALGISAGQTWYGFSYFSPDIGDNSPNAKGQIGLNKDPVDYASFSRVTDRSVEYGDADVYGGIGGYFVRSSLNNIKGKAFKDNNNNGTLDLDENGISKIKVTLYKDNNDNGSIQPSDTEYPSINTDSQGNYSFIGVPNGNYLVVIDKGDSDTPVGYLLNQNEIKAITINNADSNGNDYPYIVDTIIDDNSSTLDITKSVSPTTAVPNENLVFTITVTNNGDNTATGVQVIDKLSSAVSYISDDSGGTYNQSTGLWIVGTINKNNSKTLNITVRVN